MTKPLSMADGVARQMLREDAPTSGLHWDDWDPFIQEQYLAKARQAIRAIDQWKRDRAKRLTRCDG